MSETIPSRYVIPPWIKPDAVPEVFPSIVAAMRGVGAVAKTQKNKDQGYSFRGIDQVYSMIHDVLAEAGLTTAPMVYERDVGERATKNGGLMSHVRLRVSYWFTAKDGSAMEVGPIWSEALDTSDKCYNKALAFAHKYCLLQFFCVPTEDTAEGDRETLDRGMAPAAPLQPPPSQQARAPEATQAGGAVEPIGAVMAAKIYASFGEKGITKEQLHRKLQCANVADVNRAMLDQIRSWKESIEKDKRQAGAIFGGNGPVARAQQ